MLSTCNVFLYLQFQFCVTKVMIVTSNTILHTTNCDSYYLQNKYIHKCTTYTTCTTIALQYKSIMFHSVVNTLYFCPSFQGCSLNVSSSIAVVSTCNLEPRPEGQVNSLYVQRVYTVNPDFLEVPKF